MDKSIENMRDCVKKAFSKGCQRGLEFHKMRHAIILELKQLGYDSSEIKDMLLEWNARCEKPLGVGEQRSQLCKYVDWVDNKQCRIGCKALEDYCIGKEKCVYYIKSVYRNRQKTQELPFSPEELDKFLTERFKAEGYRLLLIVKALKFWQLEKATGEIIIVGLRKLGSIIRDRLGHPISHTEVGRGIKLLEEEGVLKQVIKGRAGNFSREANGYVFLPWKQPGRDTHIN